MLRVLHGPEAGDLHFDAGSSQRREIGFPRPFVRDDSVNLRDVEDFAQGAATELRMVNEQDRFHCAFGNDLFDAERRDGRLVSPVCGLKTFRTQNGLLDKESFCHLFGLRSDERQGHRVIFAADPDNPVLAFAQFQASQGGVCDNCQPSALSGQEFCQCQVGGSAIHKNRLPVRDKLERPRGDRSLLVPIGGDSCASRVFVEVSGRMRLLNPADRLEDFPESNQLLAIAPDGHGGDPHLFGQRFIGSGSLPVNDLEDEGRSISNSSGRRHVAF
jgi:hypothetical protein